jgi:hypothetical protein
MLDFVKLYGTTAAGGGLTVTADIPVTGLLEAVEWIDGTFANGVDAVISVVRDNDAADVTLLTLTNADNDATYLVRPEVSTVAGAAVTGVVARAVINGKLKLVVTNGGDDKVGGCIVYFER